jgi:type II secretory pathway component PulK
VSRQPRHRDRPATVLVMTLVIIVLMTMTAAALLYRTTAEVSATAAGRRGGQAWVAAMSGIERAVSVLSAGGGTSVNWQDNPDLFEKQLVASDGAMSWYFSVYAPPQDGGNEVRFGLCDEAGKMNINTADESSFAGLGLDVSHVDSLLDWRDADDEARPEGAEQIYYGSLQPIPYRVKNAPLITIEELLLVKGFDATVIYGEDANLNGLLDENEDDGNETFPPDNADGVLDRGLAALATCVTYEPNVSNDGRPRININGSLEELGKLESETTLPAETIEFILEYRRAGKRFNHPVELFEMEVELGPASDDEGGKGEGEGGGEGEGEGGGEGEGDESAEPRILQSGVGVDELPEVLDRLAVVKVDAESVVPGRVNVNTADVKVLAALNEIDDNMAQQIVDLRGSIDESQRGTLAWLVTERVLEKDTFLKVAPALTARSFQYRVRSVGFSSPSGQFRVVEAVIDLAGETPRVMYLRDITPLGLPVAINMDE